MTDDLIGSTEHIWAAGFFDGEGSFYVHVAARAQPKLGLTIQQNRREPLDRFVDAIGVGTVGGPYGPYGGRRGSPMFKVQLLGQTAELVRDILWPHLSVPKREQIQAAMEVLD